MFACICWKESSFWKNKMKSSCAKKAFKQSALGDPLVRPVHFALALPGRVLKGFQPWCERGKIFLEVRLNVALGSNIRKKNREFRKQELENLQEKVKNLTNNLLKKRDEFSKIGKTLSKDRIKC